MELTKEQKLAIDLLAQSSLLLSYYYLHHRRSVDLDFFSDEPFNSYDINDWAEELKQKAGFKTVISRKIFDRWEYSFENDTALRIEFVHYNGQKKPLGKRIREMGIFIDSLDDIAANKTFAMIDRTEPKDLFDIYFLITKKGYSPESLLKLVQRKFGTEFPLDLFWSEAHKDLKLMKTLEPLLLEKTESNNQKLLQDIEDFVHSYANEFLKKELD